MTENTGLHKVLTVEAKVQWCQLPIIKHCARMWVRSTRYNTVHCVILGHCRHKAIACLYKLILTFSDYTLCLNPLSLKRNFIIFQVFPSCYSIVDFCHKIN